MLRGGGHSSAIVDLGWQPSDDLQSRAFSCKLEHPGQPTDSAAQHREARTIEFAHGSHVSCEMAFGDEVAQYSLSEDGWEPVDQRPSRRKAVAAALMFDRIKIAASVTNWRRAAAWLTLYSLLAAMLWAINH
jgi:hypothetical protein